VERVVVLGAAGLLGREVARALEGVGKEVSRAGRRMRPGWIQFDAEGDPSEQLLDEGVGLIVNCAGVLATEIDVADPSSRERAEAVNARLPHALAEAATERGSRLVHISTDAVFRADAGRCFEDDKSFADDLYAATKRRGEPEGPNALTLRCSFVGCDPNRRRGLLEWVLGQSGDTPGYVDQLWNGLVSTQVAAVCAALANRDLFERAHGEGPIHHLFEDPPMTKHDLVALIAELFQLDVNIVPAESGHPSARLLATRHRALAESLEFVPSRVASLEALADRRPHADS
jgi:dTDP-4-dehydrorhamnose reductase